MSYKKPKFSNLQNGDLFYHQTFIIYFNVLGARVATASQVGKGQVPFWSHSCSSATTAAQGSLPAILHIPSQTHSFSVPSTRRETRRGPSTLATAHAFLTIARSSRRQHHKVPGQELVLSLQEHFYVLVGPWPISECSINLVSFKHFPPNLVTHVGCC